MKNRFSVEDKVIFITGASSGIGAHSAKMFAQEGAKVVCTARRSELIKELVEEIESAGGTAVDAVLDVQIRNSIEAAFDVAEEAFGGVDVLLNNAGYGGDTTAFVDTSEQNWDRIMEINLKGAWSVSQIAAQRMLAAKTSGSIINITSIAAHGQAMGFSTYSASKAALLSLTKSLALETAGQGLRVNAISPGTFLTEMTASEFAEDGQSEILAAIPMGRIGEVAELDGALLLFASAASAYITGACIPVDGGHLTQSL